MTISAGVYFIHFNFADYIQKLFDPVTFSSGDEGDGETLAYINFTRLLNEAEGTYVNMAL